MVDDFQIDSKTRSDNEPNEIAWLVGVYSLGLYRSIDLKIEYMKIANRTYNFYTQWECNDSVFKNIKKINILLYL